MWRTVTLDGESRGRKGKWDNFIQLNFSVQPLDTVVDYEYYSHTRGHTKSHNFNTWLRLDSFCERVPATTSTRTPFQFGQSDGEKLPPTIYSNSCYSSSSAMDTAHSLD